MEGQTSVKIRLRGTEGYQYIIFVMMWLMRAGNTLERSHWVGTLHLIVLLKSVCLLEKKQTSESNLMFKR